jgi:phosphohistidine phosphatase
MSEKIICLMRHSEAVESIDQARVHKDFDRPLSDAGIALLDQSRIFLKQIKFQPCLILCSPSLRTRQTLEWIQESLRNSPTIVYDEDLYNSTASQIITKLQNLEKNISSVMLIGHNPWMSEVIQAFLNLAEDPLTIQLPILPAQMALFQIQTNDWGSFTQATTNLLANHSPTGETVY